MVRGSWLRLAALLAVAALALHHLRYVLAFGERSGEELVDEGHAYLLVVAPLAVAALAAVLAQLLLRTLCVPDESSDSPGRGLAGLTLTCTGTLLAIYAGQEAIEGILAPGHPAGWAGVFADGGWIAIPLAAALGLPVALSLRAGEGGLARRVRLALPFARRVADRQLAPRAPLVRRLAPLAAQLAGRAPPLPA